MRWIPTDLEHTFKLDLHCHVFIRHYGVTECPDFDKQFHLTRVSSRPRHLRFNMKAERHHLCQKIKQRESKVIDHSDEEIEIVDKAVITPRVPSKHALEPSPKQFHEGPACLRQRLRSLSPTSTISLLVSQSTSVSLASSPLSSTTSLPESDISSSDKIVPITCPRWADGQVWLKGMFTCDMAVGFHQMDNKALLVRYSQEESFGCIFQGAVFRQGTYYDNRYKFTNAIPSLLAEHKAAGNSKNGKWSTYVAAHRMALDESVKPSG
jgi:hypothetical protein